MEVGQGITSMPGRERVVQKHFRKLANATAILQALSERAAPERANWHSRRLDGFIGHVVDETASDARKIYDAMRINAFKGQTPISIFKPTIVDGKIELSNSQEVSFYKACSAIDHSFRLDAYSSLFEITISLGGRKVPQRTEELKNLRMIVGESKKDGFYCIELKNYVENLEPLLRHCQSLWTKGQLKLDPHGVE